jgi:hypothetical protein
MQYGIENISTIITNVLHVGQKHFFGQITKHHKFGTQCAPILGVHFGTFMEKSKVYYREDNGGYSQAWVV